MTTVQNLAVKRKANHSMKRVADNMVAVTFRLRKNRVAALRRAQRDMTHPLSQGALMDRAIDLLIEDMKAKGEVH
jgi:hypothetical protein